MRTWDTCVVFVVRAGRWWWNAWRESTSTELHGFADSPDEARRAMERAVAAAGHRDELGVRRDSRRNRSETR